MKPFLEELECRTLLSGGMQQPILALVPPQSVQIGQEANPASQLPAPHGPWDWLHHHHVPMWPHDPP